MDQLDDDVRDCIEQCLDCHAVCLNTAMGHCLERGGAHVQPAHFRLMMACADICATAARFMLMNSPHHPHLCRECAEICTECAESCEDVGGMEECVRACRACAESCRAVAKVTPRLDLSR